MSNNKYIYKYEKYKYKYDIIKNNNNAFVGGAPDVIKNEIYLETPYDDEIDNAAPVIDVTGKYKPGEICKFKNKKITVSLHETTYFYHLKAYWLTPGHYCYCTLSCYDNTINEDKIIEDFEETSKYIGKTISVVKDYNDYVLNNLVTKDILDWKLLSSNPRATKLIEEKLKQEPNSPDINWQKLSINPKMVHILNDMPEKIWWHSLAQNPNAMHLLEQRAIKYKNIWSTEMWEYISAHPNAMGILEKYPNKIEISGLSRNPNMIAISKRIAYTNKAFDILTTFNWWTGMANPNIMSMFTDPVKMNIKLHEIQKEMNWYILSSNPGAIPMLKWGLENGICVNDKISYDDVCDVTCVSMAALSRNPNPEAIKLIVTPESKINWIGLSRNPNPEAIALLKNNMENISWHGLSSNTHPEAIALLKNNMENINWKTLSRNTNPEACGLWLTRKKNDNSTQEELYGNPSGNPAIFVKNLEGGGHRALSFIIKTHDGRINYPPISNIPPEVVDNIHEYSGNTFSTPLILFKNKYFYQIKAYFLTEGQYCYCELTYIDDIKKKTRIIKDFEETSKYIGKTITVKRIKFRGYVLKAPINGWRLSIGLLCSNPRAIDLIEMELLKDPDGTYINWGDLASNPNAIHILESNQDKITRYGNDKLANNLNAMHILEERLDAIIDIETRKYTFSDISSHPNAMGVLEKYPQIRDRSNIMLNPNIDILKKFGFYDIQWGNISQNPHIMSMFKNTPVVRIESIYRWLDWKAVMKNPNAIPIISWCLDNEYNENYNGVLHRIILDNIKFLSLNPNMFKLFKSKFSYKDANETNVRPVDEYILFTGKEYKIDWTMLSENPSPEAIKLLQQYPNKSVINGLVNNTNPDAYDILITKPDIYELYNNDDRFRMKLLENPIIFE